MLSRIVSHSSMLRRPQASRVVQRALSSSKGSSFELQAGEAGLEWRVPWKAMAGGVVLLGVTLAGLAREVHTQGHQLNTHGHRIDQLEKRVELTAEVHTRALEKGLTGVAERLEKSIAASLGELLRNADKDRRDLFHAIDRKAQVWGPTEAC